jgi:uncharacterized protein
MEPLFTLGIVLAAFLAGVIGSVFGVGGGIIIIPALTIVFGVPIIEAIGASLVGIIASSTGSAARYVGEGLVNIRLGMILEPATTAGSIVGASIAIYLNEALLALAFGLIMLYGAYYMYKRPEVTIHRDGEKCYTYLSSTFDDPLSGKEICYTVRKVRRGLLASFGAGNISGMLGIGGGLITVPVMNLWMGVPMRAATATSNFMIGVTALAGAVVFYANDLISPVLAATVAVGVFAGTYVGPHISRRTPSAKLRRYLVMIMIVIAAVMLLKAAGLAVVF